MVRFPTFAQNNKKQLYPLKNFFLATCLLFFLSNHAQTQDSTLYIVFNALTATQTTIHGDVEKLLSKASWEALAYWETTSPKEVAYMQEAVADQYTFNAGNFNITLRDPNNASQYLKPILGSYTLNNNLLQLQSDAGKTILMKLIYLDTNYLVLEIDDMRLFFTLVR